MIFEGTAILRGGLFGVNVGPLIVTNRRIIWYESSVSRPFKPIYGEIRVSNVASADKSTEFFGGKDLRIHLKSGKVKILATNSGTLDEWIQAITLAVGQSNS